MQILTRSLLNQALRVYLSLKFLIQGQYHARLNGENKFIFHESASGWLPIPSNGKFQTAILFSYPFVNTVYVVITSSLWLTSWWADELTGCMNEYSTLRNEASIFACMRMPFNYSRGFVLCNICWDIKVMVDAALLVSGLKIIREKGHKEGNSKSKTTNVYMEDYGEIFSVKKQVYEFMI